MMVNMFENDDNEIDKNMKHILKSKMFANRIQLHCVVEDLTLFFS